MLKGSIVALVTPFKDGKVDEVTLKALVEFQIEQGTQGILPCGTTGESPTLSHEEHHQVVEICVKTANGRVPVMAGTGSNATAEAIELTQHAEKSGADAALVVSPYYNKPTQEGLYQHFKAVAASVKIPIILYNIAGRTAVNIETHTVARLEEDCANIIGVKEASGSLSQMQTVRDLCTKDFLIFSGDDILTLPMLSVGAVGVVSVLANIVPGDVVKVIELFNAGKIKEAQELHARLLPLAQAMFVETNPIPVKYAMQLMGLCDGAVRLPLWEMTDAQKVSVKIALRDYGLIS